MCQVLRLTTIFLRCVPAFFRSRNDQVIVELALRQQLATYALKGPKPRITSVDRTFWVFLSRIWSEWKENLVIVQPDTVIRWHRKGFRLYWRSISKRGPGRPPIPVEVQALIRRFANENGWRARKVQHVGPLHRFHPRARSRCGSTDRVRQVSHCTAPRSSCRRSAQSREPRTRSRRRRSSEEYEVPVAYKPGPNEPVEVGRLRTPSR